MADPTALEPTEVRIALLRDVAAGLVVDDADSMPRLHHDPADPPPSSGPTSSTEAAPVGTGVWELSRHDWIGQDCGGWRWEPAPYGRQLLAEVDRG